MNELIEFAKEFKDRHGRNPFIFLSGAISSRQDTYKDDFNEVEEALKDLGFTCYNPTVIPSDTEWSVAMEQTLRVLQHVDCVFVLQDWELSVGTKTEISKARTLNIPVIYERC
mgnify:CR=1 FL=1